MSIIEKSLAIALKAHQGQVDKAGNPYILHPLRVMFKMDDELSMCAGVLHDVLEDSDLSEQTLTNEGVPAEIIEAVKCLTKREGEDYFEFIDHVKTNCIAIKVKKADIEDNLNLLRIPTLSEKDVERIRKYHKAWKLLEE